MHSDMSTVVHPISFRTSSRFCTASVVSRVGHDVSEMRADTDGLDENVSVVTESHFDSLDSESGYVDTYV